MSTAPGFSRRYHPTMLRSTHPELHRIDRIGWLRAAVLGASDSIVSTASAALPLLAALVTPASCVAT
jgi:vacuolar iron transporter family protein